MPSTQWSLRCDRASQLIDSWTGACRPAGIVAPKISGDRAMAKNHENDLVVRLRTFKELDDQLDLELEQTFPASDALQTIWSAGAEKSAPAVSDEPRKRAR
jgi:hypothetical protein